MVLSALVLVLAGCSDKVILVTGPTTHASCRPPAELTVMVIGAPFALIDMRSAVQHATDKMSTALGLGADVLALQGFTTALASDIAVSNNDDACRHLTSAYGALKALPDTPATFPDRDGIRLILALTSQALAAVMGP
jgi:hypothetical protein